MIALTLTTAANFFIGAIAGLVSVFVPRMMLLLSVDTEIAPQRYVNLFNSDFVTLGVLFAIVIGAISAILQHGATQDAKAVFMAGLGIPALLSGVLNTTSATNKLQKAEQEKVSVLRSVGDQAGIPQERAHTFESLESTRPGSSREEPPGSERLSFFVQPAYAASAADVKRQPANFDPGIQIRRPQYVLVLKRAASQEEAQRLAKELQKDVPTAQAVKTDQGFVVVDSITSRSESAALLEALQLKSSKKLSPSLLQIPSR